MTDTPSIDSVRAFWETNPVCAAWIPFPQGTPDYFSCFDRLRDSIEPPPFAARLYDYDQFKGKRVLDVGCGNGFVLSRYAERGADVDGIDLTDAGIAMCRRRFEIKKLQGRFAIGNAERLPYASESFDAVTCMGVLHHMPYPESAVAEMHRVLKPGGRLITMVYHRNSVLYRFKFPLLSLLTGKDRRQLMNEVDGAGNPKGIVYSGAELKALLKNFRNLDIFPKLIEGWMVLPKIGRLIPPPLLRPFESRWGFFLYGKGIK